MGTVMAAVNDLLPSEGVVTTDGGFRIGMLLVLQIVWECKSRRSMNHRNP